MPELPEVEGFRMYVEKTSLGKEIAGVAETASDMLIDLKPGKLKRRLRGQVVKPASKGSSYFCGKCQKLRQ